MVTNLLNNHETIIQHLCKDRYVEDVVHVDGHCSVCWCRRVDGTSHHRERIKDLGVKAVEDLILEVERCHMQWAWELRTHIQTQTGGTGGRAQH